MTAWEGTGINLASAETPLALNFVQGEDFFLSTPATMRALQR
jgi:hypothetical protein